jgi:hypothetical protein
MLVADGALIGDDDLRPDAAVTSESIVNSVLPSAAVPKESSLPDERVMEFCPPLS